MSLDTLDTPEHNMTVERLRSLYELIGRMNSVYDLQELLEFVVDQALSLTGGQRGLLLLSDGHQQPLEDVAVARGLEVQHLDQAREFVSTTVIQDVLQAGEPRLVVDLKVDRRYGDGASRTTLVSKRVRSVLAVPLKIETQLVGLIYIDHPQRAVFGQNDLDFLSAFANQSAQAINRARQHQRQLEELTLLNKLSRSVVQVLDLEQVLTRIVNEAIRMLNVETGSVLLLDETGSELYFATSVSKGRRVDIPTRLRRDQGLAGWVVSTGKVACVSDVIRDSRWYGEVETGFVTRSILCVPLSLDGQALGALQVLNRKGPHGFNDDDITRLSAFANWATVAIQNARLFQQANQARQLSALNEVALALGSTLDLDQILDVGLQRAIELLKIEAGAIYLDAEEAQPDLFPEQVTHGLAVDPALADRQRQALAELSELVLNRPGDDILVIDRDRSTRQSIADRLQIGGVNSAAFVPIKAGYEVKGVLAVLSTGRYIFNEEELSLLTSLARIIGLAAQNAIHYNQMRAQARHLTYLNEVGSALTSSLDLAHVLKVIITGVNAMLETERTSVFLIDAETDELVLRYSNEGDADIRLPAPWQGIAGWVATHDQPALVNDTLSDTRHLRQIATETGYEAHSILCVPLKVEGEVIGVVEVLNKRGGRQFTPYHQVLLVEFTRWAAIAIHNARLFDERVQAFQRLAAEQERRIAAETRGAMAAVILDMTHTMNNVVGAIRVWSTSLENMAQTRPQTPLGTVTNEIARIRRNTEEAIKLISTITGPLEQVELGPTDVHRSLEAAVKSCWWPENIRISRQLGREIPLVKANARRLEAAFHNLLSNGIHALTPQGGEIRIQTGLTAAGGVEIIIADDGPGIPPDLQSQMFNPGTSGTEGGLGIGLWLVETFVHQFDGQIDFASSESEGTTFVVTLQPLAENE